MTIEEMLKEAKAEVKRLKEANDTLTKAAENHASELEKARAEVPEATAKELEQSKNDLSTARQTIKSLETDKEETAKLHAEIGIKADADAKTNSAALQAHCDKKSEAIGSAKAAQIVAAQGADAPLPTGQGGSESEEAKPKAKSTVDLWASQFSR
jgi:chromosome segregation ATPase